MEGRTAGRVDGVGCGQARCTQRAGRRGAGGLHGGGGASSKATQGAHGMGRAGRVCRGAGLEEALGGRGEEQQRGCVSAMVEGGARPGGYASRQPAAVVVVSLEGHAQLLQLIRGRGCGIWGCEPCLGMQALWGLAQVQMCKGCLPPPAPTPTLKTCLDFCRPLALANPAAFASFSAALRICGVRHREETIRLAGHCRCLSAPRLSPLTFSSSLAAAAAARSCSFCAASCTGGWRGGGRVPGCKNRERLLRAGSC